MTPATPVAAAEVSTPVWLLSREAALCPCARIGKRRKGSFVEKTLTGAAELLRQVMFSDETSAQPGLLQRVDPRVKIVALFGLLVIGAFLHTIAALLVLYPVADRVRLPEQRCPGVLPDRARGTGVRAAAARP